MGQYFEAISWRITLLQWHDLGEITMDIIYTSYFSKNGTQSLRQEKKDEGGNCKFYIFHTNTSRANLNRQKRRHSCY